MGYQESCYYVESLAQAAGVRQAVRDYSQRGGIYYFGVERAREDVYLGGRLAAYEREPRPGVVPTHPAGSLFVMFGGSSEPCQTSWGDMALLDMVVGLNFGPYDTHFEVVDEDEVDAALGRAPEVARLAHDLCAHLFARAIAEDEELHAKLPEPPLEGEYLAGSACCDGLSGGDLVCERLPSSEPFQEGPCAPFSWSRLPKLEPADVEAAARALLEGGSPVTARQVADRMGESSERVRYRLNGLIARGVLRKESSDGGRHVAYALAV